MEKWQYWTPAMPETITTDEIYCFEHLEASARFIKLHLSAGLNHFNLEAGNVIAYRVHLEECLPDTWQKLGEKLPKHRGLWEVLDSDWINEMNENGGLALYSDARHFAVATPDNLIEIVTLLEPRFKLL